MRTEIDRIGRYRRLHDQHSRESDPYRHSAGRPRRPARPPRPYTLARRARGRRLELRGSARRCSRARRLLAHRLRLAHARGEAERLSPVRRRSTGSKSTSSTCVPPSPTRCRSSAPMAGRCRSSSTSTWLDRSVTPPLTEAIPPTLSTRDPVGAGRRFLGSERRSRAGTRGASPAPGSRSWHASVTSATARTAAAASDLARGRAIRPRTGRRGARHATLLVPVREIRRSSPT